MRLHADQVDTDPALVGRLLRAQFPHWAGLPVEPVPSSGTDHDIYRLGDDLAVRLPKIGWAVGQAAKESVWLPRLAPHLPLAVPVVHALGEPGCGYPFDWSVGGWLAGSNAVAGLDRAAAIELAAFVTALRAIDTTGAPPKRPGSRSGALAEGDEAVRKAVAELGDRIDGAATLRSWQESLDAPTWPGPDVWVHGDLLPGNLLVTAGRLTGVIDFGCLGVGDPAVDLLPAWNAFDPDGRQVFREALAPDDATWLRGRGWALRQAVVALPYYWDTNPGMVRQAGRALTEVLSRTRA